MLVGRSPSLREVQEIQLFWIQFSIVVVLPFISKLCVKSIVDTKLDWNLIIKTKDRFFVGGFDDEMILEEEEYSVG